MRSAPGSGADPAACAGAGGSGRSSDSSAASGGGSGGSARGGGGRAALGDAGSSRSKSRSASAEGTGICAGLVAGAGGGTGGSRSPDSGASPVNSAIPKRSSTSRRPFSPCCAVPDGRDAPGRTGPVGGLTGPVEGFIGPVEGRPAPPCLPVPVFEMVAAPSEERSTVLPGPGVESPPEAPAFRTGNTLLQPVQRTRTPRSVTFSSAMRNFDWQVGHWTTTVAFSPALRGGDKESPSGTGGWVAP